MNKCENCKNEILGYGEKFCSKSCSATYNNIGVRRHGKEPTNCENCGKKNARPSRKYCSNLCQREHQWNIRKEKIIKNGKMDFDGESHNPNSAKKLLKEIRGVRCENCKNEKWMGKEIPLVLDHINGNSADWNLVNLRLLCGNCDMQTDTYKGKNKGNGRFYRRQRYKNGESY